MYVSTDKLGIALSSRLTNGSSDTELTSLTTGTSIKTHGSCPHLAPAHSTGAAAAVGDSRANAVDPQQQQRERKPVDIRKNYETVPDVAGEMEKWFMVADRYGFVEHDPTVTATPSQVAKEVERSTKWTGMAEHTVVHGQDLHAFKTSHKFFKRIYKGIPDCWRRDAWYFLCTEGLRTAKDDDAIIEQYHLLNKPSTHERQIDLDIPRTMNGHIMFRQRYGQGQRALFNVLRAFSSYDEEVGYCQGMTNIVAMLLMYFEEERAFTILVHMFIRDNLHDLFIPGFPALMESFFIQERLVERYLPKVFRHLNAIDVTSLAYATRWYITLFTGGVVQYQTLLRIWDVYFMAGYDILYFVAIALLSTHQDQILAGNMDTCMALLGSTLTVPDDDRFMRLVRKLHGRHAHRIKGLREDYRNAT